MSHACQNAVSHTEAVNNHFSAVNGAFLSSRDQELSDKKKFLKIGPKLTKLDMVSVPPIVSKVIIYWRCYKGVDNTSKGVIKN